MTGRSVRAGAIAVAGLAAFYVLVLVWGSGFAHLAGQAEDDWPYLAAILGGFGVQVALVVELRRRKRDRHLEQAAGGAGASASIVGMVACCAHHLADVVPFLGLAGAAAFLTEWRTEFMLAGITINAIGVAVAARRLYDDSRSHVRTGAVCHPA